MHAVRAGTVAGLTAQCVLLTGIAATVGLQWPGWSAGIAFGIVTNGLLASALIRSGRDSLGPANLVTLIRAVLVGGVAALVADALDGTTHMAVLIGLCVVALVLDGIDGRVARHTRSESPLGARFDMEVDAFLIFLLSCYDARAFGAWVLLIGLARYAFVATGWCVGWLRAPVPPRYWRKVVAATVGIMLAVAAAGVLARPVAVFGLVVALLLLAESFGHDAMWLRHEARRASRRLSRGWAVMTVAQRP